MYEDILEGIRGAKAGGFLAVGVYEKQNEENYERIRREADVYIHSFRELPVKGEGSNTEKYEKTGEFQSSPL